MTNQPWHEQSWLEEVKRRLVESDLPPVYIRRFMEELTDHFQDLMEDTMNTNKSLENTLSRLGEADEVADAAVLAYEQRTFFGRHPAAKFLVFGVSPILSLFGLFLLAFACLCGFFELYTWLGFNIHIKQYEPAASMFVPYVMSFWMVVVPAVLASFFYDGLARRFRIGRKWRVISYVALAIVAIVPIWTVSLSDMPGQSALRCGIAIPTSVPDILHCLGSYFGNVQQWIQFLAPLLVGLWLMRRVPKENVQDDQHLRMAA